MNVTTYQPSSSLRLQTYKPIHAMLKSLYLLISLAVLIGCENSSEINVDDLNFEKADFLSRIFDGDVNDGPFFLSYSLNTVFFSKDIVSIFGEFTRYAHFPHDQKRYECKTFCKVNGKFKLVSFNDLFTTNQDKEFVRKYCEDLLKKGSIGYFGDNPPFRDQIDLEEIQSFLIHEHFLVIVFQRYVVDGLDDYPSTLKIPYTVLKDHMNPNNPLLSQLEKTVSSKSFISSWNSLWDQNSSFLTSR